MTRKKNRTGILPLIDCSKGASARCGSCDWVGKTDACQPIDRLMERVAAGEEMPVGECPDCGALAYIAKAFLVEQTVVCMVTQQYKVLADSKQEAINQFSTGAAIWVEQVGDPLIGKALEEFNPIIKVID